MNSGKDFSVPKRIHFPKLHERIQNKYNEMQKRLEKSKSVDCLTSDDVFEKSVGNASESDLSADYELFQNVRHNPVKHTVIVEDVGKQEVSYAEVGLKETSVSESECSATIIKDMFEYGEDLLINGWSVSSESLNELENKSEENTSLPSTPKTSIKTKIGSRISAARERRREEKEREKNKKKEGIESATKVEKFIFSNTTKTDTRISRDKKIKLATVTIALIEVTGLETDTEERQRGFQCRFRLGFEKWKSKSVKNVTTQSSVKWQELFSMNVYDELGTLLKVMLFDDSRKDPFVGSTTLDLSNMAKEKTHVVKTVLEGVMPTAELFFLLTITGTPFDDLLTDLDDYMEHRSKLEAEKENFAFHQLDDFSTVGRLSVIVYGAKGLASSDCYCHLRLINERRLTHTENKTNDPNWMKRFTFIVTDITSILEVIVYDEKKDEEVGRVVVPLLNINNGAKVWYALKDSTMRERAKGNNPRILLEMMILWNIIKASARVIKPKEYNFLETEEKFDRKLFLKNVARAKIVVLWVIDFMRLLKSCFEWESRKANTIGLICWLLFTWYFGTWMLPLVLLIPFIWYRPEKYFLINWKYMILPPEPLQLEEKVYYHSLERFLRISLDVKQEEKITLRKKINNIQDLIQSVQNFIGITASFGESVKNLFNFSVPFLSFLSIFFLVAISLILYCIPLQYILMAWGIKKYVRKIIWPNRVPHNEVIDLLSRVPDDELLIDCANMPLDNKSPLAFEDDQDEEKLLSEVFPKEE